jgi:hypothetical protein
MNLGVQGECNSKFGCQSYELFHFSCIKFIFHVIFEELLKDSHVAKISQGLRTWYQKINHFTHKILDFYLFIIKILYMVLHDVIFNGSSVEFLIFSRKFASPQVLKFWT